MIESVLRYGTVAWFGNLSVKLKSQINRLVHTAMKVMGVRDYPFLQTLFEKTIVKQSRKIIADPSHVLYSEYELLPSGRRYRVPTKYRKRYLIRYKNSFIPLSVNLLNSGQKVGVK